MFYFYEFIDYDTALAFIQPTPCEMATSPWLVEKGTVMGYGEVTVLSTGIIIPFIGTCI